MKEPQTPLSKSVFICALTAIVLAWMPDHAQAACLPPDPIPLWWSPAKYATDIPTDTILYVVPAMGQAISVTFDGTELPPQTSEGTGAIIYAPPSLEPNTTYEFFMEIGAIGAEIGNTTKKVKSTFTTGETVSGQPSAEGVTLTSSSILDDTNASQVSDECNTIFSSRYCIDTVGYTTLLIHAEGDAVGYAVRSHNGDDTGEWSYWPASCGMMPTVFGPVSEETCFEVQALSPQGPDPATTITCPLGPPTDTTTEESGCRHGPSRSQSQGLPLLLLFGFCLLIVHLYPSERRGSPGGAK